MNPNVMKELSLYWNGERKKPNISYAPDIFRLPTHIVEKYIHMDKDAETTEWLQQAAAINPIKVIMTNLLSTVVSRTTANGIVGRGGMFVMSTAQATKLLLGLQPNNNNNNNNNNSNSNNSQSPPSTPLFHSLLDIGAGDGAVTARLAPLFHHVAATECSWSMRWRLRRRGFEVLNHEAPFHNRTFDVISCLNVLDRADTPRTLLKEMRGALVPGGVLLLAVVLPWCPFVEYRNTQRRPAEKLPMTGGECCTGASYEDSLKLLVENVLIPTGFILERWCKLPYLSEGNLRVEYAVLHDAVLVLRKSEEEMVPAGESEEKV